MTGAGGIHMVLGLLAALAAASAPASEAPGVAAGRLVAQHNCGGCHAIGEGPSPLADAPPFRTLHARYRPGGLDQLLSEGMLTPSGPGAADDEASPRHHPRMPMIDLAPNEVANLKAFLRSYEARR